LQSHLTDDLCLDLLRGFLSPEERDRVLAHVEACPECEQRFAQSVAREERVRARGELRAHPDGELTVEPYLAEEPATTPPAGGFSWRRFFRPAFGVAAVAAAAVVLLLVIPRSGDDDFATQLQPMPQLGEEVRLRSDPPTGPEEDFANGVDAYKRGDLRAAVDLLEDAGVSSRLDHLRRVYLGSAYARLGHYEEAVRALEAVPFASVPDPWGGEGRWTLYVAYRALGRDAQAEALLEELVREPGEYGDRARDALGAD
jgi:hypothetical protein